MLFCRVTLGKSFLQFSAMKMAHAPPGHHSVIGRPSVNGLAYAEYVIYRGEQVNKLFQLRHSKVPVKRLKCCLVSFVLLYGHTTNMEVSGDDKKYIYTRRT